MGKDSKPSIMTSSEGTSPTVPHIVWDKSRLHSKGHGPRKPPPPTSSTSGGKRGDPSTTITTTNNHHHNHHPRPLRPSSSPSSFAPLPRPPAESELRMSFDPMTDLHMWTMWRVAVNGRIVDETQRRNRAQPSQGGDFDPNPYGRALVKTPLDRFICMGRGSQSIAGVLMDPHGQGRGGGGLATQQFVYYGVPRVVLNKPGNNKHRMHLPQ